MAAVKGRHVLCCVWLLLVFSLVRSAYKAPEVTFEIFSPRGLRVSIPDDPLISYFAFDANVNRPINKYQLGAIHGEVTEPTNGRWEIVDTETELKIGDIINYYIFMRSIGNIYWKDKLSYNVTSFVTSDTESTNTEPQTTNRIYISPTNKEATNTEPTYTEPKTTKRIYISPTDKEATNIEPAYTERTYTEPKTTKRIYISTTNKEASNTEPTYTEPKTTNQIYISPTNKEATNIEPAYTERTYTEPKTTKRIYISPTNKEASNTEPTYTEPKTTNQIYISPTNKEATNTEPTYTEPKTTKRIYISRTNKESTNKKLTNTEPTYTEPQTTNRIYISPTNKEATNAEPAYTERTYTEPKTTKRIYISPTNKEASNTEPTYTEPKNTKRIYISPTNKEATNTEPTYTEPKNTKLIYILSQTIRELTDTEASNIEPTSTEPTYTKPINAKRIYISPTTRNTEATYIDPIYMDLTNTEPTNKEPTNIEPTNTKPTYTKPKNTKPSNCLSTITEVRGGSACKGQIIFEDDFTSFREDVWQIEQYLPVSWHPEYPFVSYQKLSSNPVVSVTNGYLRIRPMLQQNVPDFSNESIFLGNLNLFSGCTSRGEECYRQASGPDILPPVVSGRLTSSGFTFKYGIVKVRAKLPQGDWLYPEILLEPFLKKYGSSNYASGILKIATARGNKKLRVGTGTQEFGNSVLYGGPIMDVQCRMQLMFWRRNNGGGWGDRFYEYSVTWTPQYIALSVDGEEWSRVYASGGLSGRFPHTCTHLPRALLEKGTDIAPFDDYFYITLGVAAGGITEFPDDSFSERAFKPWRNSARKGVLNFWEHLSSWHPTWTQPEMLVDYVRVIAL